MGILDFLTGAPNLNQLTNLGVDPSQVQTFQNIRNQAQTSALGPALLGGVMSALAGGRRGSGTRALEGMGRGYTTAEQQAEAQPLQIAQFVQQQKLANLKEAEGVVGMKAREQYIEASKKHMEYQDFQMKNSPNAVVPDDLTKAQLSPFLQSAHPEIQQMARMLQGQNLTGTRLNQGISELTRLEGIAAHPGNHIGAVGSAETGYTVFATDPTGKPLGSYRLNGSDATADTSGIPNKVATKMRQDYNAQIKQQEHNRQANATMKASKEGGIGTGNVSVVGYPVSYADWLASKAGRDSLKANGGDPNNQAYKDYAKTRILPGQVAEAIPAGQLAAIAKKYPEKTPVFVPSKQYWVERRGSKWYRITAPLQSEATPYGPATMGTRGLGMAPGLDETPGAAPAPANTGETNTTAPEGEPPPEMPPDAPES